VKEHLFHLEECYTEKKKNKKNWEKKKIEKGEEKVEQCRIQPN
jgi:hypothetical protein